MASILKGKNVQEKPLQIDDELFIKGINNPSYLVVIGFSGRGVFDYVNKLINGSTGRYKSVQHILIVEPKLSHVAQTLSRQWVGDIATNKKVSMLLGVPLDSLQPHLQSAMSANHRWIGIAMEPEIVIDPFAYPYEGGVVHPDAEAMVNIVRYCSDQIKLAMGCSSDSFNRWERLISNEENLKNSYEIKHLFNRFKSVPAVVIGGGPSVQDFIDECKKTDLSKRALLIACDAVLPLLLKEGIRPHIVTRCERKYTKIFKGVTKEDTKGIYFAAYPWVDYRNFDLFDESFMLFRSNGVCKMSGYDPGNINGGVSSANAALEMAFELGCKDIVLTGVDLCFVGDRSHVEGTQVEFDINKSKPQWSKVESNEGALVDTIPVWKRCLGEYQTAMLKWSQHNRNVYNASMKGAKIVGTVAKPWSELKNLFKSDSHVSEIIKKNLKKPDQSKIDEHEKKKKEIVEMCSEFLTDYAHCVEDIKDARTISEAEETKLIQQIKGIGDSNEFWQTTQRCMHDIRKPFMNVVAPIDNMKSTWFEKREFQDTILDITQLDMWMCEKRCYGMMNTSNTDHINQKRMTDVSLGYFEVAKFYAERLMGLLK